MRLSRNAVRVRMIEAGIDNQEELAEKLGVSTNTVSAWMTGKSRISIENLATLCELLNCGPRDIVPDYPEVLALVHA